MVSEKIQKIIGRAIADEQFRKQLASDFEKAVAEYDLSEEENTLLRSLSDAGFDNLAGDLEGRISRLGIGFGGWSGNTSS